MSLNVNGALFIGMLLTGIIAFFTGQLSFSNGVTSMPGLPEGIIVSNPITAVSDVINYGLYGVVFSFFLVTLFDTTGTLLGVAQQGGFMKDGKLQKLDELFYLTHSQQQSVLCSEQHHQQLTLNLLLALQLVVVLV